MLLPPNLDKVLVANRGEISRRIFRTAHAMGMDSVAVYADPDEGEPFVTDADVAVAPGIGFGEHGDDYIRIALVENEHRIRQAARNLKRFLATADEKLHNVIPLNARR